MDPDLSRGAWYSGRSVAKQPTLSLCATAPRRKRARRRMCDTYTWELPRRAAVEGGGARARAPVAHPAVRIRPHASDLLQGMPPVPLAALCRPATRTHNGIMR